MTMFNENNPPAGWYADPTDSGRQRYWSGGFWTEETRLIPMAPPEGLMVLSDTIGPLKRVTFTQAVRSGFIQWLDFSGRTSRREFWLLFLGLSIIGAIWWALSALVLSGDWKVEGPTLIQRFFALLLIMVILPLIVVGLSAITRRIHDSDFAASAVFIHGIGAIFAGLFLRPFAFGLDQSSILWQISGMALGIWILCFIIWLGSFLLASGNNNKKKYGFEGPLK
jgi:uncharacterized membrane protein YhaH (DUF805 family)